MAPRVKAVRNGELKKEIAAAPDDDGPRLVYADALMEQGGRVALRGELIHLMCSLDRLPNDRPRISRMWIRSEDRPTFDDDATWREGSKLLERIDEILGEGFGDFDEDALEDVFSEHVEATKKKLLAETGEWSSALDKVGGRFDLRRGFLEAWKVEIDDFVKHAKAAFAAAPLLHEVWIDVPREADASALRALAGVPELARVRSLTIDARDPIEGSAKLLAPIIAAPRALRELVISELGTGDTGAAAVAGTDSLATLRELKLHRENIGPKGAASLAASPNLGNLEWLVLGYNRITLPAAKALATSKHLSKLCGIQLYSQFPELPDKDVGAFADLKRKQRAKAAAKPATPKKKSKKPRR